jgi:hypothetical protein
MPSPPKAATASPTERRTESIDDTSQGPPSAVPPAPRMASTVSCTPVALRSAAKTPAPSAANALAVAQPMPEAAPVM